MDTFQKVGEFHGKFGLPTALTTPPGFPPADVIRFRLGFLAEELAELAEASGMNHLADRLAEIVDQLKQPESRLSAVEVSSQDLEAAADALADLKYVTDGTAHLYGLPLNEIFTEVHRANMTKERATGADDARSTRPHALNVVKPAGWVGPNHGPILERAAKRWRTE